MTTRKQATKGKAKKAVIPVDDEAVEHQNIASDDSDAAPSTKETKQRQSIVGEDDVFDDIDAAESDKDADESAKKKKQAAQKSRKQKVHSPASSSSRSSSSGSSLTSKKRRRLKKLVAAAAPTSPTGGKKTGGVVRHRNKTGRTRPPTAFALFIQANKEQLKSEGGRGALFVTAGEKWKEMTDGEKAHYEQMAAASSTSAGDGAEGSSSSKSKKKKQIVSDDEEFY